jgi:hypothetical protein
MTKFKQKLSKQFKNNEHFQFQNWLEYWSQESVDNFVKNFIKFQDDATKVVKEQFVDKTKKFADVYFAQKAIQHYADENLPFKTLVLLGQKLNHPAYKEEMEKVIQENVIKFEGIYYKLNDIENQNKVQKAIKNYQFEECRPVDKKVA